MSGLHAKSINIGSDNSTIEFSYSVAAVIIIGRQIIDSKAMYLCDLSSGVTTFFGDAQVSVTCENKTVTITCTNPTFRQGIIIGI